MAISSRIYIGIGEYNVTRSPGSALQTMALGSCIGLMIIDPTSHSIGLAHIALPEQSMDPGRAANEPARYADTAVPTLIQAIARCAGHSNTDSLLIKIAGGAQILNDSQTFNIGARNLEATKNALIKNGLRLHSQDTGGKHSRTVLMDVDTTSIRLTCPGRPDSFL